MKVISFGCFPPKNENFNILPFRINNTSIIDIHNNNHKIQNLYNLDILRLKDGIYFNDNIIRCFSLWMKYQSANIEFINSQCFHGEEILPITQKLKMIKDNFSNYNLILIPHQFGVH